MSGKPTHMQLVRKIQNLEKELLECKKLNDLLQQSEQKYRLLTENVSDIIWTLDLNLKTTYVSPSVTKVLGFTPEERMCQEASELMTPESYKKAVDALAHEMETEQKGIADLSKSLTIEIEYYHKNGHTVWTENIVRWMRDSDGNIVGIYGVSRDITHRKKAEMALQERDILFKKLSSHVPGMIYQFKRKPDGTYCAPFSTDAIKDLFGCLPEDVCEDFSPIAKVVLPEDLDKLIGTIESSAEHMTTWQCEYRVKTPGSPVKWLFGKSTPEKLADDSIVWHGFNTDITESKRTEDALRESEEKYRKLFDLESDAIFLIDKDTGKILEVNKSASDIYGYSRNELLKLKNVDLSAEPDQTKQATQVQLTQIPIRHHRKKDGTEFPVEITASHLKWKGRDAHIAAIRDITFRIESESARTELEKQLYQSRKMEAIGTLAGGIAHDFNNILSVVVGYTELAQMKLESDSEIKDDLNEVITASKRAKDLVKQILAFSRQTQKEKMPIQMGLIVKETLKLIKASLPATIEIHQNIQSESIILSDPTQIHQIIMNLCANAAYAMRQKGGILEIDLTDVALDVDFTSTHSDIQPGAYQKLTICDTGHGMTPEVMNRIFDPFYTTKPKGDGTGLGLSVVHGIVKDCGGTITVYSEANKGTAFNLYFPIIKGRVEEKPGKFAVIPTGTERILVVDDEKAIIDITKLILTSLGYVVEVRASSLEAFELFKTMPDKFDLVITDLTMPQMTGDQLAREMIKIRPDIPVILCTGFSEKMTDKNAETIGVKAFLQKPLLKEEMAHTIRKVLDEAKDSN